jgi:alpha-beta hydrolase superfamily lysophospholipase
MNDKLKPKRRLPSLARWILWVLVAQFILLNISSAIYAYRLTHFYSEKKENVGSPSRNLFTRTWKLFTGPRQVKKSVLEKPSFLYETVQLHTANKLKIECWYAKADSNASGTVILFHGITSNKSLQLEEAHEFLGWGYNVLMVDLRGHGNSEGITTTIGYREFEEVKLAYDFIAGKGEERIYLYGVSLGAVIVAKAVVETGIKPAGVILDMPFSSLKSYLKNKARTLGFPGQPFATLTTFWIGLQQGFNGYKHCTVDYVHLLRCPVMMQWGRRDQFILRHETEEIYTAIGSTNKKLVVYESAGHESFLKNNPVKWRIELERFLSH